MGDWVVILGTAVLWREGMTITHTVFRILPWHLAEWKWVSHCWDSICISIPGARRKHTGGNSSIIFGCKTNYKLLLMYRVPKMLAAVDPSVLDKCWRGRGLQGSYAYISCNCAKIRPHWAEIRKLISKIITVPIVDDLYTVFFSTLKVL